MALIAIAIYDTEENKRSPLTARTLESLLSTLAFSRHRVVLVVNGQTEETAQAISEFVAATDSEVIYMPENVGTARAINQAWKLRQPGEHAVKMDNDVVIYYPGWADVLEDCISRDSQIGIIGLKRKDCIEKPDRTDFYKSELAMLPQKPGEPWRIVERVNHVMGTCQMYSAALLDKIGYLYQSGLYGYDDSLAAVRCHVAGFYSCFYPAIEIDHLDPPNVGTAPYTLWKQGQAAHDSREYNRIKDEYLSGKRPVWVDADYK